MALQAEALLRLQRHDEADAVFNAPSAPRFGVDESVKFFGTTGHAYVLTVRAQVDMAAGRSVPFYCEHLYMRAINIVLRGPDGDACLSKKSV
jgi:hypothetical protein